MKLLQGNIANSVTFGYYFQVKKTNLRY